MKILVTGSAGFIGFHAVVALLREGYEVLGIDNLNDYYDPRLKEARLNEIERIKKTEQLKSAYTFVKLDISNNEALSALFDAHDFDYVLHLAAQAGVRYSLQNPQAYVQSNLVGFSNIIELAKVHKVKQFVYASSSSVYGMNTKIPYAESDRVDAPVSLYAATKKSNEMVAHSYSHLFKLPCTGLRFFTVYGPWGRPDMAYYKFTKAILDEKPIEVYNYGQLKRDFTYIDDIIQGIVGLISKSPEEKQSVVSKATAPNAIYNIGNNQPVALGDFIDTLESCIGKKAIRIEKPMQKGDVYETYAAIDELQAIAGFKPTTSLQMGLTQFVNWYKNYLS